MTVMPTGSTPPVSGPTDGSSSDRSPTTLTSEPGSGPPGTVDLYWIPLGAGANVVRVSGAMFEAISARLRHRNRSDLYHSALVIDVPEGHFVIEQAPVPAGS